MPESITQIRRRNLLLQLNAFTHSHVDSGDEGGAATAFAEKLGIHKSLLSKLKGEGPSGREISDKMARQIEASLSLPYGWMDEIQDNAPATAAEISLMELALQASRATNAKGRTDLRRLLRAIAAGEKDWRIEFQEKKAA